MSQRQPRRALEIYSELQYAALLASPERVAAFTNGVFILVQTAGGNFSRLAVKGENGIGPLAFQEILPPNPDLPAVPGDVLLDVAAPTTFIALNGAGVGVALTSAQALARLVAAGALTTADLPAEPGDVLLDVAAPTTFIALDGAGVGIALSTADALTRLVGAGALTANGAQTVQRTRVVSGLVADINGGVAPFDAPGIGQMAFATNAVPGGTVPCWYNGAGWVTADGAPLV